MGVEMIRLCSYHSDLYIQLFFPAESLFALPCIRCASSKSCHHPLWICILMASHYFPFIPNGFPRMRLFFYSALLSLINRAYAIKRAPTL